jgi:3-oxo-5-alpha-steroid 4-dehydrogenase 3 / polyprenol reductase
MPELTEAILATKQRDVSAASAFSIPNEALVKIVIGTPLFFLAWVGQYRCHVHLAGLKKYSLPDEGLFRYFVSPHYTCEFFLYVALSIVTAPEGKVMNRTVLSSLLFVLAGLGVTADRTKQWYINKFGAERVAKKWRMIPFIF